MKALLLITAMFFYYSVLGQDYQKINKVSNDQCIGVFNQHQTLPEIFKDSGVIDLSDKFAIAIGYMFLQPNRYEFLWMIKPQYFINNKNSVSISLGYFPRKEHGHLFGGYLSPRTDTSIFPSNVSSVTKSGSAQFAMINHSTIFPIKVRHCLVTFEIAKGIGLINLRNELINSETENYLFFNSKVGLSGNVYFRHFHFGVEPIELEFSLYKYLKLFTYRPSVHLAYTF